MITAEILRKKRIGQELSGEEIRHLVDGMKTGEVSDVQITAFLTSTCIHSLTSKETGALTFAMRDSGDKFDFSSTNRPKIDKHSTGGVGDKLSLLLVPLVVPCGLAVPMISGRGLGHTGGTLDKLDSIVGFNVRLEESDFYKLMLENFCFMASQTEDLVPADKKMYHIRDITGNVDSIGLITASILSKKLVEDLDGLVLDMKVGNGAFMRDFDSARTLAESMAGVAREVGLKMRILFTSMEQPLGRKIGNWLEVEETVEALSGNCPVDIRQITERLASAMLQIGNIAASEEEALLKVRQVWESGTALDYFRKMVSAQGGNLESSFDMYKATPKLEILADKSGVITQFDTLGLGLAGIMLGAGRRKAEDALDYGAGFILHKKLGEEVLSGEPLLTLYANDNTKMTETSEFARKCVTIGNEEIQMPKLILDEWIV